MKSSRLTVALAAIVLLACAEAFAQRGSLRGKIVGESGQPIEGVVCNVELAEGGRSSSAETKDDGTFVRGGLRPGVYDIACEKEGYRPLSLQGQVSGFEQLYLGEHIMYELQPGELTESQAARANELLEEFNVSAESGDDQATLDALMQLDSMMPDNPEVQFNIAATHEKMGDEAKALEYYAKAAELKPDFYDAWLSMATIRGDNQEWAEAQAAMKKALDLKPDPVVAFNYAVYAQNAGDTEAAKAGYEKTLELDPSRSMAHYQLGLLAVNAGENEEAIAHFEKFLEVDPNHAQADAARGVIEALKQKGSQP